MTEETLQDQDARPVDQAVSEAVERQLRRILTDSVLDRIRGDVDRDKPSVLTDKQRMAAAYKIWRNNGWIDKSDWYQYAKDDRENHRITYPKLIKMVNESAKVSRDANLGGTRLQDSFMPTDASILLPQVISAIVREAAEPALVLTQLMRRISHSAGETITFPAVGGMSAEDMAPGQEYPEKDMRMVGTTSAIIGKVGIAVRFYEELLRYSQFDMMTLYLNAAGRAMARRKEQKVADMINNTGTVIYDNDSPNANGVVRGQTSGRNSGGNGNGTLTLGDIFQMFADLLNAGFIPNTLIMNPMGWLIFAQDETLRSFGFANGGPLWGAIQGQPGLAPTFASGGVNMGPSGSSGAGKNAAEMSNATLHSQVPTMFPAPLSIVVSPFIAYDAATESTTIVMCDRNELGILVEDEPIMTESWTDPARDVMKVKLRERYAIAVDNEGDSIVMAKGVRMKKSYNWEDIQVTATVPATGLAGLTGIGG